MRVFSAADTTAVLPFATIIHGIEAMFAQSAIAPLRHHHTLTNPHGQNNTLLLMPAWQGQQGFGGVKIVNVVPDNSQRGLPAISASYLLFNEQTGEHLAVLEGAVLTARRTAAASALGAKYLANPQAKTLLVVGAGKVARQLPEAFAALFPLEKIMIWNRGVERAQHLKSELQALNRWQIEVVTDLASVVQAADIISCATLAQQAIIQGSWLRAGQHLDLLGSFTAEMREADDEVMRRAQVYIDTEAALKESGELLMPLASGALQADAIRGTLYDLCAIAASRYDDKAITVFKGVGHAIEDLACAIVAYQAST